MKLYMVFWRDTQRRVHHGFTKARSHNDAFDITMGKLQDGCQVTHVYEAAEHMITPQSTCINFANTTDYYLF